MAEQVPFEEMPAELVKVLRIAIADPGAVLPRGHEVCDGQNVYEPVYVWAARAVASAVLPIHERQVREQIAERIADRICAPTERCNRQTCRDCIRYEQAQIDAKIARGEW